MKLFRELVEGRGEVLFIQAEDAVGKLEEELKEILCSTEVFKYPKEKMIRVEIKTCGDKKEIKEISDAIKRWDKSKKFIDTHFSVQSGGRIKLVVTPIGV
jgi:hypothetical protein